MATILGYSAFWDKDQDAKLAKCYRIKSQIVEDCQIDRNYGTGLKTLLVFYNFETTPNEFDGHDYLERKIKVYRYNSKEKSIRVNVFVGFDELTNEPYEKQIEFYYTTTLRAIEMVQGKFKKRKNPDVDVKFDKLKSDIQDGFLKEFSFLKA